MVGAEAAYWLLLLSPALPLARLLPSPSTEGVQVGDDLAGLTVVIVWPSGEAFLSAEQKEDLRSSGLLPPSPTGQLPTSPLPGSSASSSAHSPARRETRAPGEPQSPDRGLDQGLVWACYTKEQLLRLRPKKSPASQAAGTGASGPSGPSLVNRPEEEIAAALLKAVQSGRLPPPDWTHASSVSKREALLVALERGHMHAVFAMQPESEAFRSDVRCYEPETPGLWSAFLDEALARLMAHTAAAGKAAEGPPLEPTAWLLEHGAASVLLLPKGDSRDAIQSRLAGLKLLGMLGSNGQAIGAAEILECLTDGDVRVKRAAAESLGFLGPPAALEVPKSVGKLRQLLLKDPDAQSRQLAARSLGLLGPHGLEAAVELLREPQRAKSQLPIEEIQSLAALAIGAAGPAGAASGQVPVLVAWLIGEAGLSPRRGPGPVPLRLAAAHALGLMAEASGDAAALALAEAVSSDADEHVREAAVNALGQLGHLTTKNAVVMGALASALDDTAAFVREAAATALGNLNR